MTRGEEALSTLMQKHDWRRELERELADAVCIYASILEPQEEGGGTGNQYGFYFSKVQELLEQQEHHCWHVLSPFLLLCSLCFF